MKLLSTVAAGALLLAGCAPFEHGHYANDVDYVNDVGDRPGTPVLVDAGYSDPYYDQAVAATGRTYAYSEPVYSEAVHSAPVYSAPVHSAPVYSEAVHSAPVYSEPPYQAPIVQASYAEQVPHFAPQHVEIAPPPAPHYVEPHFAPQPFIEAPSYVAPQPAPPAQVHVEIHNTVAPAVTTLPVAKPLHYAEAPVPIVAATSVSVAEERYIGETRYAPPEVINAPPVYMRGPGQISNQPFPDPAYPQFGAPGFGYPQPAPQGYGFPPIQPGFGYGNPYGAVAANARPPYPQQGYGNPYGNTGCTTSCGGTPVF